MIVKAIKFPNGMYHDGTHATKDLSAAKLYTKDDSIKRAIRYHGYWWAKRWPDQEPTVVTVEIREVQV